MKYVAVNRRTKLIEEFYAHTDPNCPGKLPEEGAHWQGLKEHLAGTAENSEKYADVFGSGQWGHVAGLWHDTGKYSIEFQNRLRSSVDAHIEQVSRVDHSTYGAQQAFFKWPKGEGKILAYIIAGHHGGLPEGQSNDGACLSKRIEKLLPYEFYCPDYIFNKDKPSLPFNPDKNRFCFELSFFIRMLFSCLTDSDFLDTEKHMCPEKAKLRIPQISLDDLKQKLDHHLKWLQDKSIPSKVNSLRANILYDCRKAAQQNPGLFSLTVPTGGGKTLSSMAFGLDHAIRHGHRRIIYVIPYTSIIEQNARVFRDIFGDEAVLEHHSNYEPAEEDYRTRLASENWDASIIVTTNVQFFESLFASRGSRCRKLHNIANSVIILDEVQTLPPEYLLPCLETIRELTLHYHCSHVLCSATQPAIQYRSEFPSGLKEVREITKNPCELYRKLKRVEVQHIGQHPDAEIIQRLKDHKKVLCIVNTRKYARSLYEGLGLDNTFHLSASMYPLHRSHILQDIKKCLVDNDECRVISTQLVEAGVDIDFPVVYRAMAGLDSIAQAAGRCNREGHLGNGHVYVFKSEKPLPPGHFRHTAQIAEGVIRRFYQDMLSLDAIENYFKEYYWKQGERLDKERILCELLQQGHKSLDIPFRTIADKFKLIQDENKPVIITREPEAQSLIHEIRQAHSLRGFSRKLQKYTVHISPWYWNGYVESGAIEIVRDIFPVLVWPELYNNETGLTLETDIVPDPDNLIC